MIDRVALFVTCLVDTLFPEVGKATVTVLERLGIEVVFPAEQTCCGQLHANSGYPGEATLLARRFVQREGRRQRRRLVDARRYLCRCDHLLGDHEPELQRHLPPRHPDDPAGPADDHC